MRALRKLFRRKPKESSCCSNSHSLPRLIIGDSDDFASDRHPAACRHDCPSAATATCRQHPDKAVRPLLYSLGQQWAWSAISFQCQQVQENPDAHQADIESLQHVDSYNGDTILHTIVIGKPPASAIQALLQLCPDMAHVRNHAGLLPLHVACSYRVSAEVLRCLLRANPQAVGEATPHGSYPLHILCDHGCEPESILAILEVEQGIRTMYLEDGIFQQTPLCLLNARKNLHRFARVMERLRSKRIPDSQTLMPVELVEAVDEMRDDVFWRKACWLVLADYFKRPLVASDMDNMASILHAFVNADSSYSPSSLQECAILVYADQVMGRDSCGRTPLHVAAACANGPLLQQLLEIDPNAANARDNDDQTALHIATRTRKSWSDDFLPLIKENPAALNDLKDWSPQLQVKILARIPKTNHSDIFWVVKASHAMLCR